MMISNVKGSFRGLKGSLTLNEADPRLPSFAPPVDVSTVSTGDAQRDGHLKSADFFDAEQVSRDDFQVHRT